MSKSDRPAAKKPAADVPPESLDQVRDILFGGQMRTVETRLKGIEERLGREQDAMRAEFAKRVADLETFARRETQALHERVAAESDARTAALKSLLADLKEAQKAMDRRHAKLEQETSLSDAELRDQLVAQAKAASAELAKANDRLRAELAKSVEELQGAKADRASLAAMLADVASRLTDGPGKGAKGAKG